MQDWDVQHTIEQQATTEISEREIRDIVEAVLRGDTEKFGRLFDLLHNRVYALAWNLTGNYDDAMDVLQECFLRAYRALSSWKGNAKFTTWLHRITVNTAIDYIRREARHHDKRITGADDEETDKEIQNLCEGVERRTPLMEAERKELRRRLVHAINQLRGMQRRCFILRYFGNLPLKEVALIAGCGEGTIKRHLFRARERLRQLLKEG